MTIAWCASMSAMGEMDMPRGWAMSMMWMRMPGQTWSGAAAAFVGMWVVMMVAMMLPSLTPTLWRYRQAAAAVDVPHAGRMTALVGVGYFVAWAAVGAIVFPLGVAFAAIVMQAPAAARAVPVVVGMAVMMAGVLQQTAWKERHLAFCREELGHGLTLHASALGAWRHGWCLGVHCIQSCAGLTAVALALGVMDLRVMAAVAIAITAERLAPAHVRVARAVGMVVVGAGVFLLARVIALG